MKIAPMYFASRDVALDFFRFWREWHIAAGGSDIKVHDDIIAALEGMLLLDYIDHVNIPRGCAGQMVRVVYEDVPRGRKSANCRYVVEVTPVQVWQHPMSDAMKADALAEANLANLANLAKRDSGNAA